MNGRGRTIQEEKWLAVCLATIAGYVDAYGFLTFMTFVSFMSGNTTHAGSDAGRGLFEAALPATLAIISFVAGVIAGTLLGSGRRSRRTLFGVVATLLALYIICARTGMLWASGSIIMLSFTMGVMNTALSRIGSEAVNLTFVTGTLSQIGSHLAHAFRRAPLEDPSDSSDTHLARAGLLTIVWLGFLIGAVLSGMVTPHMGSGTLYAPLVVTLALAVFYRER